MAGDRIGGPGRSQAERTAPKITTGVTEHSWMHEGLANYLQLCVHPQSMPRRDCVRNFRAGVGRRTFFRPLKEVLTQRAGRYNSCAGRNGLPAGARGPAKERTMVKKGRSKGTMRFTLPADTPDGRASLAGDFNDWAPVPMKRQKSGYAVTMDIPPGTYQYKFILDGRWVTDPDNSNWSVSPLGTVNSVVTVG
jgi:hypothetical protein